MSERTDDAIPDCLREHLRSWIGAWPAERPGITLVANEARTRPGWDGLVHRVIGVATTDRAVVSAPPEAIEQLARLRWAGELEADVETLRWSISSCLGRQGQLGRGRFRWSDSPAATPDVGEWVAPSDQRVPLWLKPFNGDVLIAWDDDANYGGGVGRKQHDRCGHEISVGTEPSLRGRGIARQLVATAARRILADGAIPTYLHAFDNHASSRVADAAGFPDRGWTVLSFFAD